MKADEFLKILIDNDFGPFTGVPCSLIKDLIHHVGRSKETQYYIATSEGEAMGIAAGLGLSRKLPVVVLQNDGLGNTLNPLSSLQLLYDLPALMIVTWRGEPEGKPDAPQHRIMGEIILDLLDLLNIPYSILKDGEAALRKDVRLAKEHLVEKRRPYAFIVRRGYFEPTILQHGEQPRTVSGPKRIDYIRALAGEIQADDLVLATTGYTGREMIQEITRGGTFYMAGSMGCITSIGLGVALENPECRVYVLDGDGALLMKLGTLATIGFYQPRNLIHILFDNGVYESTGGQKNVSSAVSFSQLALHSSYRYADSVATLDEFLKFLETSRGREGPMMCHVKVSPGTVDGLGRPSESCPELKDRLMDYLTHLDR